jgi:hypothetical protein
MEIRITGWGYENIRRFKKLNIDLLQGKTELPHTTLIMMRNGTGKTTTITLMRAALSGNASEWSQDEVRAFKPTQGNTSCGSFYINVHFGADKYHYNLKLDYDRGKATYETARVGMHGGLEFGHILPLQFKGIFNTKGFIERFIFDGEQAKKILSSGDKEAELAITFLYQIDKIDGMISKINELVKIKQSQAESHVQSLAGLKSARSRMENRKKTLDNLILQRETLSLKLIEYKDKLDELERDRIGLITSDKRLRDEQKRLVDGKADLNNELIKELQKIETNMKEPFQVHSVFNLRLTNLMQNMQTLKLPKTTAREFFKELSESEECICGRSIGEAERMTILNRANSYLGEDDLSAINAIKDKLRNYRMNDNLKDAIKKMTLICENIQGYQSELDRLVLQLDEDAIRKATIIENEQMGLKQKISEIDRELNILCAPLGADVATDQNNIELAEKLYVETRDSYTRATGSYYYTMRALKLTKYLFNIKNIALNKLKKSIIAKTNEKIHRIITDEELTVQKIDGSLILNDRTAASEGQTLAIAYSYIGSLFEHSSFGYPFIIDSPAASMDLGVRREVANIIPKLFKQLIIFVTSGEVAGFADSFYKLNNILFATVEGKDNEKLICTFGQEYFSKYQSEGNE